MIEHRYISRTEGVVGGRWCLKGRRISMGLIVATIAEGQTVEKFADDHLLEVAEVRGALAEIAAVLDDNLAPDVDAAKLADHPYQPHPAWLYRDECDRKVDDGPNTQTRLCGLPRRAHPTTDWSVP